ncbi:AvaI/BsoBI family type II restriction endonuclease [Facklamia languida]
MISKNINSASDLVTDLEDTRAGFISSAIEKSKRATAYVNEAKALKNIINQADDPNELQKIEEILPALLTASGLSDKSIQYFNKENKEKAIKKLLNVIQEESDDNSSIAEEIIYRYLLIRGDSLGGSMRNLVGNLAEQQFLEAFLATLNLSKHEYKWLNKSDQKKSTWIDKSNNDDNISEHIKAIQWSVDDISYILALNLKIPKVNKNIDICLFRGNIQDYEQGKIVKKDDKILFLGEIKGGIDPAGADERWKTANSALQRIRNAFGGPDKIATGIIAYAIEKSMAEEIFNQLQNDTLTIAANMNNQDQLYDFCNYLRDINGGETIE